MITTQRMMQEFDDIIAGLPAIYDPGTNIIDAFQVELPATRYLDFGGGVCARECIDPFGMNYGLTDEERQALAHFQQSARHEKRRQRFMWCRFAEGGLMKEQAHPQIEEGFVISGAIADRTSGKRWVAGQCTQFPRMATHEPFTPIGCFLGLVFTGVKLNG